jgi:uncharacterized protein YbjQ (UPF0145 family)
MVRFTLAFVTLAFVFQPLPASARNTAHELSIQAARDSALGQERLLDMPLYFGSQGHPAIAEKIREGRTNKATHSMFRSDEEACEVAFLSGLVALQQQAQSLGANAIVNIRTNTGGPSSDSSDTYMCAAGGAVARVNLTGTYVKLR